MLQLGTYSVGAFDVGVTLLVCLLFVWIRRLNHRALPPGPRRLPLVGNIFDVPKGGPNAVNAYRELAAKYGDVVVLNRYGQILLVLSSATAVMDLLEKRSAIYSDRTASPLVELAESRWPFSIKRYGDDWRRCRRLFWQYFNPNAVASYHSIQQQHAQDFVRRLLHDQQEVDNKARGSITQAVFMATHGVQSEDAAREYLRIGHTVPEVFRELAGSGSLLVNFLPWLRLFPSWFPGARWKRELPRWRSGMTGLLEQPFRAGLEAMAQGDTQPCIMSRMLDALKGADVEAEDYTRVIKEVTSQVLGAGVDTMTETLLNFFRAMALYPDVQKRAQAELDVVVGSERLPEHGDMASLPYLRAIFKECLRWNTFLPFGLVHRCQEDDVYRDWRIPEGSLVMVNVWMLLNDPEVFPDPETFRPERFLNGIELNDDAPDPEQFVFGFGRRVCPGRHFAQDLLFIYFAFVLHVFDILPQATDTSDGLSSNSATQYLLRPKSIATGTFIG
ncbi:cytochrome P450 [Trametes sanguinea]|nr:cytochrome P450 [Trametes sanguinea]